MICKETHEGGATREAPVQGTLLPRYGELAGFDVARRLLDAMPTGVLILDGQRQTVYANPRVIEIIGIADPRAVLGKRPGEIWTCPHSADGCGTTVFCDYCGAAKVLLAALEGKAGVGDFSVTRGDTNQRLHLRATASPLAFGDERLTLFTVEEAADAKRRRALEQVFFHDVLNTAGTISGAAQLLGVVGEEQIDELQQMILNGSRRLTEEIRAQRDLLAAENDELVVKLAPVASLELLRELADLYATHPVARKREIRIAASAEDVQLTTDRTLLGRIIGNMLKNALEAVEPGAAVTIACSATPETVRFEVHNPTHLPADVQMQLFDRTFSTKGPGRGLGTYSMKLLAESFLGGDVSFCSTEEEGTTFRVTLPRSLEGRQRRES